MFSKADDLKLQRYLQEIINKPRPIDEQPHVRQNGKMFCEDWYLIEILKYFINGHAMYLEDPPPNRLKNNSMWSKNQVIAAAKVHLDEGPDAERIINEFKRIREKQYARSS